MRGWYWQRAWSSGQEGVGCRSALGGHQGAAQGREVPVEGVVLAQVWSSRRQALRTIRGVRVALSEAEAQPLSFGPTQLQYREGTVHLIDDKVPYWTPDFPSQLKAKPPGFAVESAFVPVATNDFFTHGSTRADVILLQGPRVSPFSSHLDTRANSLRKSRIVAGS